MKNRESVATLRRMIECKQSPFENRAGVYRWWFKEDAAMQLLGQLPPVNTERIAKRLIDGNFYWALYFGISGNLRQRAAWHINQKHTPSAVKSGYLSTLRQVISALLNEDMTKSQDSVNKLMDTNCYLEWDYTSTKKEAEELETNDLSQSLCIYALNRTKNKTVSKEHLKCLTELRSKYRK